MELPNVRAFLAVVREGSFSGAARSLHLAQPSVSARLKRLEEELGQRLLERRGRRTRLTPAGEHLFPLAEDLVRSADDLGRAALDFASLKRGRLDVGTTDLASIHVLPAVYRRFLRLHRDVDLSVRIEGTEPLMEALRAGRIELAVANLPAEGEDLAASVIDRDDLLLILPARHPLGPRKRLRLEDLGRIPMITFEARSVTRRQVDRAFAARGVVPPIAMEISSPEAIKKLVEVGLGFSVLPSKSVRAEIREGRLASPSVAGLRLERRIGLIRVKQRYLSPAAQAFASLVEEETSRRRISGRV
jgi:DNA-binding transcriptional LysR family regulator